ncbi:MAG: hypothetical protein K6G45_04965 [Lachnospiraceae bacterium]|nr:hypothetical protein [Lachnospiraceae bacterium]
MKIFRRIISFCIIVFLLLSTIIPMNTSAISERSINVPYEYKCVPGTEAWNKCSTHDERCRMNDISDSDLELLTTNALVRTIANYPFLLDLLTGASYTVAYDACKDVWNFLRILEKRDDAFLELYNVLLDPKSEFTLTQVKCLTIIMTHGHFIMDDYQLKLKDRYIKNMKSFTELQNRSLVYPTTPSGNDVTHWWCRYDQLDLTPGEIQTYKDEIKTIYGIFPIQPASRKYNCHSYAWHSTDYTNNKWWIDYPDDYLDDPYYSFNNGAIQSGNKVVYRTSISSSTYLHSGIVNGVGSGSGSTPNITITSKWGECGLYVHNIYNCPEYYGRHCDFYYH